jgi:hypothetical protein
MKKSVITYFFVLSSIVCFSQNVNSKYNIDKLQKGENYSIIVESQGYISYTDTIVISRSSDNQYKLMFNGTQNILSKSDIDQIRDYEKQINNCCSSFGCSETSVYRIIYKNQNESFKDFGCELERIGTLLMSLEIEYR